MTGPDDFRAARDVSRETLDRLTIFEGLLKRWTARVNLIAPDYNRSNLDPPYP